METVYEGYENMKIIIFTSNSKKDICRSNQLDFLRLLYGLQNSNSPKSEHCQNFLEEMQSLFSLLARLVFRQIAKKGHK